MSKVSYQRFGAFSVIAVTIFLCFVNAFGIRGTEEKKLHSKARYYYLRGTVSEAEGNIDKAYEYYKKAFLTDPEYTDAAFAYGNSRMLLTEDTFSSDTEMLRNLSIMRKHVDTFPEDVISSEGYAYYASLADTFPEAIRVYRRLVKSHPGLSRLYYPQAYYYANLNHMDSAVIAIREYERLEGSSTETLVRKISYLLAAEDTLGAIEETKNYVSLNPGKAQPLIDMAMVYEALGRSDSALVVLEDALQQYPDNAEMKFDIAMLYASEGDSIKFHKLIAEAFRNENTDFDDRMVILNTYLKALPVKSGKKDYEESDKLFEFAETLYSSDAEFMDLYSDYEILKGDYKTSFEKSRKAFELEPNNDMMLGRAMSLSILAERQKEGMKLFENFTNEEGKKKYSVLIAYISASQGAGEYDKAIAWIDTLIDRSLPGLTLSDTITETKTEKLLKENDYSQLYSASVGYEVAGDIFAKIGKKEDALRSYENSIILTPDDNPSALNNYAYYLVETIKVAPGTPEFDKAKQMSRESITQSEKNPQGNYYDTYAWILFREGNYKDALEYQELAVEAEGENPSSELLSHYGDILFMNGKPEEALKQWKKALELEPTDQLLKKKVIHQTFFYE